MSFLPIAPVTITIDQFCRGYGFGKTFTNQLIRDGKITTAKIGRKTLIIVDSANALIQQSIVMKG